MAPSSRLLNELIDCSIFDIHAVLRLLINDVTLTEGKKHNLPAQDTIHNSITKHSHTRPGLKSIHSKDKTVIFCTQRAPFSA